MSWLRQNWLLLLVVAGLAALVPLFLVNPTGVVWYPKCFLYLATGLHCPGCGGLRAAHHLLHGRLQAALAMNPLAVCMAPIGAAMLGLSLLRGWRNRRSFGRPQIAVALSAPPVWQPSLRTRSRLAWTVVVVIFAFALLRNLPWYPCTLLAPHES